MGRDQGNVTAIVELPALFRRAGILGGMDRLGITGSNTHSADPTVVCTTACAQWTSMQELAQAQGSEHSIRSWLIGDLASEGPGASHVRAVMSFTRPLVHHRRQWRYSQVRSRRPWHLAIIHLHMFSC